MKKRQPKSPIAAEVQSLEPRQMLSASTALNDAGQLQVNGTNKADQIDITQDQGNVLVNLNGRQSMFPLAQVTSIVVNGNNGADNITLNGANLPTAILDGGHGNDNVLVVSSSANNVLIGGNGNDLVSTTGSGSDTLIGGGGNDTLYAIVGSPNIVVSGGGQDRLITRDGVEITDANRQDTLIAFRGGEAPGTLRDGVLYLGLGVGTTTINQVGSKLLVSINGVTSQFKAKDVKAIAGVGSAGNDVFINNSSVDSIYYGANGNDVLIGGRGDDVLKGGNGDDVILGNGGQDFLTGDAGRDVILGDPRAFVLRDLDDLFASPSCFFN